MSNRDTPNNTVIQCLLQLGSHLAVPFRSVFLAGGVFPHDAARFFYPLTVPAQFPPYHQTTDSKRPTCSDQPARYADPATRAPNSRADTRAPGWHAPNRGNPSCPIHIARLDWTRRVGRGTRGIAAACGAVRLARRPTVCRTLRTRSRRVPRICGGFPASAHSSPSAALRLPSHAAISARISDLI